ncbi:MAG: Fur family transcriptional regulator [Poseidonibacter sp.]|uniref:Fur family transcriptional regulator n=1 Tax=Poseidonibacter sp. TaxID=2321188 RepID=UPI00359E9B2D
MTNYTSLLKDYDLKVTPQRVAIVEELYLNGHMNIDDLYKKLLAKFPSVSLATIYKNINAMIEKVFLSEVKIPNTKSVFELVKAEHAHLVCSSCGAIEDVTINTNDVLKDASTLSKFEIKSTNIVFSGLCPHCSK